MKILKFILGLICILIILGVIFFFVDKGRVDDKRAPMFATKMISKDEKKVTYLGLGYKVVAYPENSVYENFADHKAVKIGSWFMNFKIKEDGKIENKEENVEINSPEDFYNYVKEKGNELKEAKDNFSKEEAEEQGYYVITNEGENLNKEKLDDFLNKVKEDKTAFLRIAVENKEGKIYIYDILNEGLSKKVFVALDKSRGNDLDEEEDKVKLEKYDNIDKVKDEEDEEKEVLAVFEGSEYNKDDDAKKSMIIGEVK